MSTKFGDLLPYSEPAWYHGSATPYYNRGHIAWRAKLRQFVDEELRPHTEVSVLLCVCGHSIMLRRVASVWLQEWIERPEGYPLEVHRRAYELGIQGAIFPEQYGGTPPDRMDVHLSRGGGRARGGC